MAVGQESARFLAMSPDGQRECVADVRRRLTRLPSEAFVIRGEIIYAIAAVRS